MQYTTAGVCHAVAATLNCMPFKQLAALHLLPPAPADLSKWAAVDVAMLSHLPYRI